MARRPATSPDSIQLLLKKAFTSHEFLSCMMFRWTGCRSLSSVMGPVEFNVRGKKSCKFPQDLCVLACAKLLNILINHLNVLTLKILEGKKAEARSKKPCDNSESLEAHRALSNQGHQDQIHLRLGGAKYSEEKYSMGAKELEASTGEGAG